ncbi:MULTISPECIES: fructosamine kinase family protein [unclassified Lentimonas]|uniref:fructosamine kinase family protein n=1 Tax=unclassified Lentimonas TaxID=2630993 RepID=UPI00132B6667|nr:MULTISPECIES: fructosamine kinase family protein [unclassified Lentimonas]CAA6689687.1 Ribulosamine/erythrulosamine 3-kinase potentially involved in protein deglycation [Lentimonas sp. CC19]CAA6690449.1 Ribulosamine/erythrulosamine 3-kinase potentially involved in protein deglycation [Lentimonas sp. CC10]CAA7068708.1 Ribulosamine/erythrulosamine 3-kinase potentially involved in protein deglycation [Lentimonas sp. CC11]
MDPKLVKAISAAISLATDTPFRSTQQAPISGGDINDAYLLSDGQQSYFVKINSAAKLDMFITESQALAAIRKSRSIRAPQPITHGRSGAYAFLALEAIQFGPPATQSWQQMGQQLATLHRTTAERFGWHRDNTIGSTPQLNQTTTHWSEFFCKQRLCPQLDLAQANGIRLTQTDALLERAAALLADHHPDASLLHGDLWKGNTSFCNDGTPVIFDPASYYGDRETDLAFTEYFGGFAPEFYDSYHSAWPLPTGHDQRKPLYNLYHTLNHANLFGGNYVTEAQQTIFRLLA